MKTEENKKEEFAKDELKIKENENSFSKKDYEDFIKKQEVLNKQIEEQQKLISQQETIINEFKELINTSKEKEKEKFNLNDSLLQDYKKTMR